MYGNSWRSTQGGESAVDKGDWRSQLTPDSRQQIVNKIMDTLKRHLPFHKPDGLQELKKIAIRFEENIYSAATSQTDYVRKITLKILMVERNSQNRMVSPAQPNSSISNHKNPQDPGSRMQYQTRNKGQQIPMEMGNTQVQAQQQLLSQNIQNSIAPSGVQQGLAGLKTGMASIIDVPPTNMPNVVSQNANIQNVQNIAGVQQQSQQGNTSLFPNLGGQPSQQQQQSSQQSMAHIQFQTGQLQQQLGMQHQSSSAQRVMQQSQQTSGTLLQQQNMNDHQKQLFQPQRAVTEASLKYLQQQSHSTGQRAAYQQHQPTKSTTSFHVSSTSPENHVNPSEVAYGKSSITELPIDRLLRVVNSMLPDALSDSMRDIRSIADMFDRIARPASGNGSRAAAEENLTAMTNCCLQARNFATKDGTNGSRRYTTETVSVPESTPTSGVKWPRLVENHSLLEEIRNINGQLIETVLEISDDKEDDPIAVEGGEGTVVKCSYTAVALSPNFKAHYASPKMSQIQPLRLLVPNNYPNSSPIFMDKFPIEPSKESEEDLSAKMKSMFSLSVKTLSEPFSLGEIAKMWDACARAVMLEYAQQNGGGSFTSKYGDWDNFF